ncbi:helix-turn-helix domain-containing protein [Phytobacter sp. V91]|uniref:helix-turn-helix domain-containing protein n=1 Tax=Phytobacter sp. V91 TaxID=3369425 RepID=UPI003F61F612
MNITQAINAGNALVAAVPFLGENTNDQDYKDALSLVDYLLLNDPNNPLVEILTARISAWEEKQPELVAFKAEADAMPEGVTLLRLLIDTHNLTLSDFRQEIGTKSMVSRILSGERKLTLEHIKKLAVKFDISPALFL